MLKQSYFFNKLKYLLDMCRFWNGIISDLTVSSWKTSLSVQSLYYKYLKEYLESRTKVCNQLVLQIGRMVFCKWYSLWYPFVNPLIFLRSKYFHNSISLEKHNKFESVTVRCRRYLSWFCPEVVWTGVVSAINCTER